MFQLPSYQKLNSAYASYAIAWAKASTFCLYLFLCVICQDWYTVVENYHRMNATISDLIMGNSYKFRIYSENKCGKSEDATVTKDAAKILKTGETLVRGEGSQSLQPEPGKQDENTKNITKNVTKEGKGAKNKKTPSKLGLKNSFFPFLRSSFFLLFSFFSSIFCFTCALYCRLIRYNHLSFFVS